MKDKFTLFVYCNFLVLLSTTVCCQNINKQIVNIADENLTDYSFLSSYHYLNQRTVYKDDIEFVTEFSCLLGHPVFRKVHLIYTVQDRYKGFFPSGNFQSVFFQVATSQLCNFPSGNFPSLS